MLKYKLLSKILKTNQTEDDNGLFPELHIQKRHVLCHKLIYQFLFFQMFSRNFDLTEMFYKA